ncbi:hypothetical protein C2845_PM13G23330 [Panicum miliaceum]|uniref:Myb-like protein X n=1 Tax=Panicum miliaceum TaxID=4540 RepID=A0A3L6RI55_PANMI|nr:hypothetical protein C2845_PM13G23330 [Panicum miliaceum]
MRCVSGAAAVVGGVGVYGEAGGSGWGAGPGKSFHLLWLWVGIGGGDLKSGVVLWRTGFAEVATNWDMVDERDFGYPSGELQCGTMSRCFPFPPPGYEATPRREKQHKDLLKKEKHKEKKHKKEKDRGKGERKEKDRVHRKDKHTKKHKRKKRRDRRNNEDRDKDKKQSMGQGTRKNYKHGNRKPEERRQNEAVKDIKPTDELITRTFGQEGNANHKCDNSISLLPRSTESISVTGSEEKERNSLGRMVKKSEEATQCNHGMVQKSDSIVCANKKGMARGVDSKTKIKNGKSLQVGSAEMHSRRKHSCNGVNMRQDKHSCNGVDVQQDNYNARRSSEDVHTARPFVSGSGREANGRISPNRLQREEEMELDPEISVHSTKGKNDRINTKGGTMGKENRSANNCRGKMNQQSVQNKEGEVEGKVKTNYCKAFKGKDMDRVVKKRKTEYKNKQKEMEKNGTINEHKHEDLGAREDQVDNFMRSDFLNGQKFTSDNVKKQKDFDANTSPDEHSMMMTKMPRVSPTKDEEICRHSQRITPYSSTELLDTNTHEIGWRKSQDGYNSAITGSRCSEEGVASVSSSGYRSNRGYLEQPHPDTKYLSQLYSIPPAQDFSDFIDQDWLFSQDCEERKTAAFEAAESDQVWSDAQLIDSADVIALPYVVPL